MAETQNNFGAAVRGVSVQFLEFFSQNEQAPLVAGWDPVVMTIRSDKAQETYSGKTGVGTLSRFSEGGNIPKGTRNKLFDTTIQNDQYGKQVEVTRKMLMNRDWNTAFDEFKDLVLSKQVTLSKAPAQIFNRAFTSGDGLTNAIFVTTYGDGKALASTVHPRSDGGTAQSNASATGITLTESNFETARVALAEQLQDDGTPIAGMGRVWVVVPTALEKTATIITGSDQRSGTANNDLNFYTGGAFEVLSSHWLNAVNGGSDTQWQLVAPNIAKLRMQIRNDQDLGQSVDKSTKSVLFDVISDWGVGSVDWHGTFFTRGDNATYSA